MDNAIAVVQLSNNTNKKGKYKSKVEGYIPTEAYPGGLLLHNNKIYVANIESTGPHVSYGDKGYTIHNQLASISVIAIP